MKQSQYEILPLLDFIDPARCTYQEWVNVGMALKHEGCTVAVWDEWSSRDALRYHSGECDRKWETFSGVTDTPVTGGTLVEMARRGGWSPSDGGHELDWDDIISSDDDYIIVDKHYLEPQELQAPREWQPERQLITYLETLFNADENVGYVTRSYEQDGRHVPSKGSCDRTAGQLIEQLRRCGGDIGSVLGDYDPAVGAWIRFNPLDGQGVKNENVTDYRYALVESDSVEIEKQNAILRELELPVACLVHSGNKSLHAIVHIEAADYAEYRKRVDYLYNVCKKNGLDIDTQNRNPSRLSRMPGVTRGENRQYLIDTNIGKSSWPEWVEWIESINDELPDIQTEAMGERGNLAPCLIDGILRQGHKMLLAGSSKAGKSFALIELAVCIAEGLPWLGYKCAQGSVLYVNLELDKESCKERFTLVREALRAPYRHAVDLWHLRGKSIPMDKLAPKLIRRAQKKNYIAVIIDPIYKVITGDENSADQMAHFCNQFDRICSELGCAVIYCHHHSKGAQGQKKSMDRASGSGVFARDPDALLDLIELEPEESVLRKVEDEAVVRVCADALEKYGKEPDDGCSAHDAIDLCAHTLPRIEYGRMFDRINAAKAAVRGRTAWRIECTLREFRKPEPLDVWFEYPVHVVDKTGVLKGSEADMNDGSQKCGKPKKSPEERKAERMKLIEKAYDTAVASCSNGEPVTVGMLMECSSLTRNSVKNYIDAHPGFARDEKGIITKLSSCQNNENDT